MHNECWINTLLDLYTDTLFLPSKQERFRLTREKLLCIIKKTEEDIEKGLTTQDMEPFFIKFRIPARVLDAFSNMIYRYDPPTINYNVSVFYCMTKNNHIYTLNYDLNKLEHKNQEEEEEVRLLIKASKDYEVEEDKNPNKYRMINGVSGIMPILQEASSLQSDSEQTLFMVVANDGLNGLFFALKNYVGYEPGVSYDCNRFIALTLIFQ